MSFATALAKLGGPPLAHELVRVDDVEKRRGLRRRLPILDAADTHAHAHEGERRRKVKKRIELYTSTILRAWGSGERGCLVSFLARGKTDGRM